MIKSFVYLLFMLSSPQDELSVQPLCKQSREALSLETRAKVALCCSEVNGERACSDKEVEDLLNNVVR